MVSKSLRRRTARQRAVDNKNIPAKGAKVAKKAAPRLLNAKRRLQPIPPTMRGLAQKGIITSNIQVDTQEGLKWALANLHPCGEGMTEAVGYPDSNNMPTHCTRMQRTYTISPVTGKDSCTSNSGPSLDQCSWNLMVITTPWPEFPWLVCRTKGNDEPMPLSQWLEAEGNYIVNGDNIDSMSKSVWGDWIMFAFPNFMDASKFGIERDANDLRKKYQKVRVVAKGTTTYLNASRLYDGGRVICGQYPVANRYLDTFEPNSVSIDMESLVDKVISRLCVEGSGSFTPEQIRKLTAHRHQVDTKLPAFVAKADVTGAVTAQVKPEVELKKSGSVTGKFTPLGTVTASKPEVKGSVEAGAAKLTGSLTIGRSDWSHAHTIPLMTLSPDDLTKATTHRHQLDVAHDTTTNLILDQDVVPVTVPAHYTSSVARDIDVDYSKLQVVSDAPKVIVDVQAPEVKFNTFEQTVRVQDNVSYDAVTRMQAVDVTDGRQVSVDVAPSTEPTSVCGLPQYVGPEVGDELAPTCATLSKKGDKLTNVKLVRDTDVKDNPDWYVGNPPCDESALFYGDSKATTWAARMGTYQVMRINNWDLDDCHSGAATFYDLRKWEDKQVVPRTAASTFTTNVKGTGTWAVAYYRNINMATSVTLKCVQFTEGVVNPTGPFANLTPLNVDPDPAAIALVTEENRRLAHAYPSSFNDFGTILGKIFTVAKSIGKAVNSASGHLTEVPVIGGFAKGLHGILSALGL